MNIGRAFNTSDNDVQNVLAANATGSYHYT